MIQYGKHSKLLQYASLKTQETSIMHLIHADAWMIDVIQDNLRKLVEIRKGVNDPFLSRNLFGELLQGVVEKRQTEVLKLCRIVSVRISGLKIVLKRTRYVCG